MSTPRGKGTLDKNFEVIYGEIKALGYQHTTGFLLDVDTKKFYLSDITRFYRETVKNLKDADVCVFEVSVPSLAIGHLIGIANELGKPIVALYTDENLPFFLSGVDDERIQILHYDPHDVRKTLKDALEYASEKQDVRFNFFVSPEIQQYLAWVAKYKRTPRAVYLRELLEADMKANKEWKKEK